MTHDQLTNVCKLFTEDISLLNNSFTGENNNQTAACCDTQWNIPENYSICGQTIEGLKISDCVVEKSYWTWDYQNGINIDVIIMVINIVIFWAILIFIETDLLKIMFIEIRKIFYGKTVVPPQNVDNDVQKEKESVYTNNNLMKVINLTKKFGRFDAVRGLTFGVRERECFGLLGVNGAGKTTTFRY